MVKLESPAVIETSQAVEVVVVVGAIGQEAATGMARFVQEKKTLALLKMKLP